MSTPIFQSSTFAFENAEHGAAVFRGEDSSYVYTRLGNPTQTALETEMAYLENGEAALALASGMAAATTAVLTCCQAAAITSSPGDTLYGGTHQLFTQTLPRLGITRDRGARRRPAELRRGHHREDQAGLPGDAGQPDPGADRHRRGGRDRPRQRDIPVLVDNTFCTPYLQNPLDLGADIVLHSATKYIGGHGDTVAGILVGKAGLDHAGPHGDPARRRAAASPPSTPGCCCAA